MRISYSKICLLTGIGMMCFSMESFASNCTSAPDCSSLGYTKTSSDCSGVDTIKCPFDTTKVFCVEADAEVTTTPQVGYVLYSDKTFSSGKVSGKIAIGVVFDLSNRLAVALTSSGTGWVDGAYSVSTHVPSLTSCDSNVLSCATNGQQNTSTIIAYDNQKGYGYGAAQYCYKYQPDVSKIESWYAAGKWFLPSAKELYTLYQNKTAVNTALAKVNGKSLSGYYWSSNGTSANNAWIVSMDYNSQTGMPPYLGYGVRAVVKY